MIRPTKHLNLNICVLRAASILLNKLQNDGVCSYEALRSRLIDIDPNADSVFVATVNFLYLLGRVEYHPQTDSFEYILVGADS